MSILLGLCDEKIADTHLTSWSTNKIGGKPDWMYDTETPKCKLCGRSLKLSAQLYCPLEESIYHRALYIFGCINRKCWNKSESWRAYRSQQKDQNCEKANTNLPTDNWGTNAGDWGDENPICIATSGAGIHAESVAMETKEQWCEGSDDWGDNDMESRTSKFADVTAKDEQSPFDSSSLVEEKSETNLSHPESKSSEESLLQLQAMVIDDVDENEKNCPELLGHVIPENNIQLPAVSLQEVLSSSWHKNDTEIVTVDHTSCHFQSYYINVFEDSSAEMATCLKHEKKLIDEYRRKEGTSLEFEEANDAHYKKQKIKGSTATESYEKSVPKHGDKIFQKFLKEISTYPEQVIRYCWNGKALLMSACQLCPVPRCCCGSDRSFEVQLMPALVTLLTTPESTECQLEFGVVIVYTCKKSCWASQDTLKEEYVLVQSDPDQHLFKT